MKNFKKYYKTLIALLLLSITIAGCADYLTVTPESRLVKDEFWKKREDVESALAATYDSFRDIAVKSFIMGELRADMITLSASRFGGYTEIAASNISESASEVSWSPYYKTINYANTLMYFADSVALVDESFTQDLQDAYEAEALFLRSLCYFYIVRIWKDAPLMIKPSVNDKDRAVLFPAKSSEKEIIKQIISDLTKAKDLAFTTEYADKPTYFKGRANKYSIMALLADVYLWDEQYQNALNYSDSIINTGMFKLEPYENWFTMYNPGNSMSESLFEIQFDDKIEQRNPMYDNLVMIKGNANFSFKTVLTNRLFSKQDLRWCGNKTPVWKYQGVNYVGNLRRSDTEEDANFIYYRYADVLLTKAEALNELDRTMDANEFVRLIAERAGMSHPTLTSKEEMRKAILDERGREFVIEGKRWFDILRFAKRDHFRNKQLIISMILSGADVKVQAVLKTKVYDTLSYYLPVPEQDLLYNPQLVQNPFYDR